MSAGDIATAMWQEQRDLHHKPWLALLQGTDLLRHGVSSHESGDALGAVKGVGNYSGRHLGVRIAHDIQLSAPPDDAAGLAHFLDRRANLHCCQRFSSSIIFGREQSKHRISSAIRLL